ncbi:MAG: VCBS repeat-containing protein [Haliscomenobacter sp.]|nr:FG-GAP-like repeat-containing protein [Haliscomenobacter sp.]MBK9489600.1 VCBS repeat-containing protein [Haliscomenobacter sp.]
MNTMIQKLHIFLSACLVGTLLAAQTPTITGFTPAAGSIGATVTLTGTNFNPTATNNIVHFGAVKATVSSASPTSLTVTVPLGATYKPITVLNTVTGLSAASAKPFLVTFSGGIAINTMSFATKTDFTTASQPRSVASGDLDGDGKPELIATNNGSMSVSLLRNTSSSGTLAFAAKVDVTTGAGPSSAAVGDLDGDGKLDLAIGNQFSNTVSILRNTSTGGMLSFAAKIDSAVGSGPLGVAIGDLDGDGKPDLALANFSSSTVSVLRNTSTVGSISFARKVDFITGTNSRPYNIGLGDIDGDGKLDLVAPNAFASNVSVIRNTSTPGNLSFAGRVDFTTGDTPSGVAIGDLDGDGKPEVAISNLFSTSVSVFRNTSKVDTVALAAKVDFATGATPFSVSMGDLDGDGKLDLTVANSGSSSLSVLRNTSSSGTLSFVAKVDLAVGSEPNIASIGDLDGDGKPDLATTNLRGNSASVLRNQLTLPLQSSPSALLQDKPGIPYSLPAPA